MAHNKVFDGVIHVVALLCAVIIISGGIYRIVAHYNNGYNIIIGIYLIAFGVLIFVFELKPTPIMYVAFGFFKWWAGRGLFLIMLGTLSFWNWNDWTVFFGIFPIVVGVLFIVMAFVKYPYPKPLLGGEHEEIK
eukprot:TRINITY_DN4727_c0_g1_i2.p1 TRINITY_DN4727_c0_g1~~TRINITY_DN4727_c0_g1_i2.p1  ORF type:complete len:134 (+),score=32.51 TRINITY_DN4727_c0_g1_i2:115-516(+)